uniref:Uncharacterized protein n=1 Tax=Ditylenchus dipsaci TaxID=166011 RepID=A0A915EBF9_9BILA
MVVMDITTTALSTIVLSIFYIMSVGRRCLVTTVLVTFANVFAQYGRYGYNNNSLINYCPQYLLPYVPNVFQTILSLLTFSDIGILLRNLAAATTLPLFLNNIQDQSPQLYNSLNQINSAYGNSLFPFLTSTFQNPAYQNFAQQLSGGGLQPALISPQQSIIPQQQSILPQQQSILPQQQLPVVQPQQALPAAHIIPNILPPSGLLQFPGSSVPVLSPSLKPTLSQSGSQPAAANGLIDRNSAQPNQPQALIAAPQQPLDQMGLLEVVSQVDQLKNISVQKGCYRWFGLPSIGNLLQPFIEETEQVVDSLEDVVTDDQKEANQLRQHPK